MMVEFIAGGDDVKCPKCKTQYDVDWHTEYGDPLVGEHTGECPNLQCGAFVSFECHIKYSQVEDQGTTVSTDNKRLEPGDIVRVDINGAQITISQRARILARPYAVGDSWIFEDMASGQITYISEGCTIVLIEKKGNIMSELTDLLAVMSDVYFRVGEAMLYAEDLSSRKLLTEKQQTLIIQMDKTRKLAETELIAEAKDLINKISDINIKLVEKINNMQQGIDIINNIASFLDYVQKVIEFAAKCAP